MNRTHSILLRSSLALAFCSAAAAQGFLTPPQAPPENPVTVEKAVLGKILFWDEQLSSDGSIACGTCHIPSAGGGESRVGAGTLHPGPDGLFGTADDSGGSPGVLSANAFGHLISNGNFGLAPQVTSRNSQSSLTGAYFDELFWDGRAGTKFADPLTGTVAILSGGALESQSLGPLVSDVEMADEGWSFDRLTARLAAVRPLALATNLPSDVAATLVSYVDYPALFTHAFGTPEITPVRIAFALATYQRTLVPNQTPWDDFQRGDFNALTAQQFRGMNAFDTTAICAVCHSPPLFATDRYHSLALRPSSEDLGRSIVTGDPLDAGKFKVPSLRNVSLRKRWFHNGSPGITSLRDIVDVYASGVGGGFDKLDPVLSGLMIPAADADDIAEFLLALTDPRVAAETAPFDRPTLRSERTGAAQNPELLGTGAVAGTGGFAPEPIIAASPFFGADEFRIGLSLPGASAGAGTFAAMRLRLTALGGLSSFSAVRALGIRRRPVAVSYGVGGSGYATWRFPLTTTPAMVGLAFDAQWWVRDAGAPGGVARSESLRFTVE